MGVEAFCLPRAHLGLTVLPKKQPPERDGFSGTAEGGAAAFNYLKTEEE
jgi:hypothetical protein